MRGACDGVCVSAFFCPCARSLQEECALEEVRFSFCCSFWPAELPGILHQIHQVIFRAESRRTVRSWSVSVLVSLYITPPQRRTESSSSGNCTGRRRCAATQNIVFFKRRLLISMIYTHYSIWHLWRCDILIYSQEHEGFMILRWTTMKECFLETGFEPTSSLLANLLHQTWQKQKKLLQYWRKEKAQRSGL